MTANGLHLEIDENIAEAGQTVTGRVVRQPDSQKTKVRAVRVRLRMFTQGRGETDSEVAGQHSLAVNTDGSIDQTFSLHVPKTGPISYDGRLIRVKWEVEARLDVKLARDPKIVVPVLVVPAGGWALYDRAHPLRTSTIERGRLGE